MKSLFLLLILFSLSALGETADPFVRLSDSLVRRLPESDKPINLCVGKFEGNDIMLTRRICDELEIALSKHQKVQVITRSDLAQLEIEGEFQKSNLATPNSTLDKVTVQGVNGIVRGRYEIDGHTVILYAEIAWLDGGAIIKDKVTWETNTPEVQTGPVKSAPMAPMQNERTERMPLAAIRRADQTTYAVSPEKEELVRMISNLRATTYNSAVEKLYQRRLLQLLEMMQNGASVNTVLPNANGTTALHNACGLSRVDVVRWLLANGADTNARTAKGASVEACVGGANAATISKLLRDAKK